MVQIKVQIEDSNNKIFTFDVDWKKIIKDEPTKLSMNPKNFIYILTFIDEG
jgi:hypothetical protein